jgi:hypothetical protein
MTRKRVRVGSEYVYVPVLFDVCNPPAGGLSRGDVVKVVNLPGAPKANTMGMCYVDKAGVFGGMVMTNSLLTKAEWAEVQSQEAKPAVAEAAR